MDFEEVMKWCHASGVKFSIDASSGVFLLKGKLGRIESEYPFTYDSLSSAIWTVGFAIKTGTDFHKHHGFIPQEPK